jgi:hypothetical protein
MTPKDPVVMLLSDTCTESSHDLYNAPKFVCPECTTNLEVEFENHLQHITDTTPKEEIR